MDSKSGSFGRRVVDLVAVAMIGDGALGLLLPAEHMKTWTCGPQRWRDFISFFAERPGLTRTVGAVEICVAFWWVRRSLNSSPHARIR
ncbi:hypothetical protein [Arthrobacter sp. SO3]|uniref:hypothetical protein n=1 Tax=Arthrobacter sp. SO3 TaxID=1897057 RepID=UPI001CFFB31F|nr:hypothetical protein [Arthrobacter sp. SO3]MCB5292942.1 hypothetical protein [Arthrobacter sp. SO3]